jgi:hypothetical protein
MLSGMRLGGGEKVTRALFYGEIVHGGESGCKNIVMDMGRSTAETQERWLYDY